MFQRGMDAISQVANLPFLFFPKISSLTKDEHLGSFEQKEQIHNNLRIFEGFAKRSYHHCIVETSSLDSQKPRLRYRCKTGFFFHSPGPTWVKSDLRYLNIRPMPQMCGFAVPVFL